MKRKMRKDLMLLSIKGRRKEKKKWQGLKTI